MKKASIHEYACMHVCINKKHELDTCICIYWFYISEFIYIRTSIYIYIDIDKYANIYIHTQRYICVCICTRRHTGTLT